jgi:hypothetical protein
LVHFGIVILHARVTVVSAREVERLAAVTVAVAFASIRVQLGLQALSVSILTHKSTDGDTNFLSDSLNVLPATQLPNTGIDALVLSVISPIFCIVYSVVCMLVRFADCAVFAQPALPVT